MWQREMKSVHMLFPENPLLDLVFCFKSFHVDLVLLSRPLLSIANFWGTHALCFTSK